MFLLLFSVSLFASLPVFIYLPYCFSFPLSFVTDIYIYIYICAKFTDIPFSPPFSLFDSFMFLFNLFRFRIYFCTSRSRLFFPVLCCWKKKFKTRKKWTKINPPLPFPYFSSSIFIFFSFLFSPYCCLHCII